MSKDFLIHPFKGLLSDISPVWHGQLEGSCVQPRPPPKGVCRTETINQPKPSAVSLDEFPHYHPSARYLNTYEHRPEQV